jgi:REP element-mobilizing transposase RayT
VTRHDGTHVTLSCVPGLPSLRRPVPARLIEEIFAAEGKRKGFRLVHFAIRPGHLHLVCEADGTQALSRGVQRIASRIARRLNKHFGRRGRFFADRFHCVVIKTPRQMRNVLRYVYLNEHKDRAKRGKTLEGVDPYSSHCWFDGWAHLGRRQRPPPPAARDPVAEPRAWLLRKGWRRHGLIRTDEKAPGAVSPVGR